MSRVTVCFAGRDAEWADRVAEWASQKGYDVDRLSDDTVPSDAASLSLRLIEADALLAIVTGAWAASPACRAVFHEAHRLRRPVFPLMVSCSGELVIGSDFSRLTLSDNETAGLAWLSGEINAVARATRAGRTAFQFCAFISYSHTDKTEASWIHRKIEAFRMPKPLVGKTTAFGMVGRRLGKAFRDDEEFKGASDLGALIQGALEECETLILICSPRSARSAYVNEEVISFKRLGREARIIPVIIDGKPNDTETECFPPGMTRRAGADGLLTDEPAEPMAVDLREHGKRRTLLKVIAGITGVEFDELERRDRRRRSRQIRAITSTSIVALSVLLGTGAIVDQNVGRQAITDRAAKVLAERRPVLAAHLALAGLPKASDLCPTGGEAASTLKASGYAFATSVLDPQSKFHEFMLISDGTRLITRSFDDAVRLWDVESGMPVADFDFNHYSGPTTFAWLRLSPDETRLLMWNSKEPPELWDAHNGQWIANLEAADVGSANFSGNGHWIVVCSGDGSTAMFDSATGSPVAAYGKARGVHVSADGSRVVTELEEGTAVLWDGPTGQRIANLGRVSALTLSRDGKRLVTQTPGGNSVTLSDAVSGKPIAELQCEGGIYRFAMSADDTRLATVSLVGEPVLWDVVEGRRIGVIGQKGSDAVSFSESGDFVVAYSSARGPFVSNARTGAPIGEIGTSKEGAGGLTFVPGHQRVVLLTRDIGLVLRDIYSGALIARLADDNDAYGLRISHDGRLIQAKDANHWVKLWDGQTGALIGALAATREGHSWMIDRQNVHAATLAIDGTIRLRRLPGAADTSPVTLRDRVCRENQDLLGAFPAEERDADTPAGRALRGRPWHACDWRGLKSLEGWWQFIRYWGTHAGLPWDYAPWEKSALDKWLRPQPVQSP